MKQRKLAIDFKNTTLYLWQQMIEKSTFQKQECNIQSKVWFRLEDDIKKSRHQ